MTEPLFPCTSALQTPNPSFLDHENSGPKISSKWRFNAHPVLRQGRACARGGGVCGLHLCVGQTRRGGIRIPIMNGWCVDWVQIGILYTEEKDKQQGIWVSRIRPQVCLWRAAIAAPPCEVSDVLCVWVWCCLRRWQRCTGASAKGRTKCYLCNRPLAITGTENQGTLNTGLGPDWRTRNHCRCPPCMERTEERTRQPFYCLGGRASHLAEWSCSVANP